MAVDDGVEPAGVVVAVGHFGAVRIGHALHPAVGIPAVGCALAVAGAGLQAVAGVVGIAGAAAGGADLGAVAVVVVAVADGLAALGERGQAVKQVVVVVGDVAATGCLVFGDEVDVVVGIKAGDDLRDVTASGQDLVRLAIQVVVLVSEHLAVGIGELRQVVVFVVAVEADDQLATALVLDVGGLAVQQVAVPQRGARLLKNRYKARGNGNRHPCASRGYRTGKASQDAV